jgi:hypothetical protein
MHVTHARVSYCWHKQGPPALPALVPGTACREKVLHRGGIEGETARHAQQQGGLAGGVDVPAARNQAQAHEQHELWSGVPVPEGQEQGFDLTTIYIIYIHDHAQHGKAANKNSQQP